MELILALLLAYLIGSIPFGLLLTKAAGLGDIRAIGSGNIGATNVLRTGNKKLALLTLLLDGGKGWLAVYIIVHYMAGAEVPPNQERMLFTLLASLLCPLTVTLGHVFPVWLKFRGGKGVATALGATLGLIPNVGLIALVIWLCVFAAKRISSLAAVSTFILLPLLPILILGIDQPGMHLLYCASLLPVSLLVIYRHKDNIRRLLAGTEPKFGKKP